MDPTLDGAVISRKKFFHIQIRRIDYTSVGMIAVPTGSTIKEVKESISRLNNGIASSRQSLRTRPTEKGLPDDHPVHLLDSDDEEEPVLYLKDLGPQIAWRTVFLAEYIGPLLIYLFVYTRPAILYGELDPYMEEDEDKYNHRNIALFCWSFHYLKRIYESIFVHRFSHSTMPLFNIFKNCAYYYLFALFVAHNINHPDFVQQNRILRYMACFSFFMFEYANYSIHIALRDLRPPGSTQRLIPMPNINPCTHLFFLVSCPNYTYEIFCWMAFTGMTRSPAAFFFTIAGAIQMIIWAQNKHKAYKNEFPDYPEGRTAIFPLIL